MFSSIGRLPPHHSERKHKKTYSDHLKHPLFITVEVKMQNKIIHFSQYSFMSPQNTKLCFYLGNK